MAHVSLCPFATVSILSSAFTCSFVAAVIKDLELGFILVVEQKDVNSGKKNLPIAQFWHVHSASERIKDFLL